MILAEQTISEETTMCILMIVLIIGFLICIIAILKFVFEKDRDYSEYNHPRNKYKRKRY